MHANKHESKCLKASECSVDLLEIDMYSITCLQITWLELEGELGNIAWLQSDDDDGGGWNRISSESKVATWRTILRLLKSPKIFILKIRRKSKVSKNIDIEDL